MPLRKRRVHKWPLWQMPMSYNIMKKNRMADARNVCTIQEILQTRPGTSRYNSTAISASEIISMSYFKDNSSNRYVLSKNGTVLYSVPTSGASTSLKTGLNSSTFHRGITWNGRHFLAIGSDGLYQYDGTTFTQLGQAPPSAPTVAAGTGALTDSTYQVAVTYYDSTHGFETNIGAASSNVATVSQGIDISAIPTTASNANIDKVRIYLKNVTSGGSWIYVDEISLGTSTYSITSDPTSTTNPPTTHAAPLSGGAKYLAMFGDQMIYAGNSSYPSDVFFSEPYLPDCWDDTDVRTVLTGSGNGPITGLAVGFYDNNYLNPYICIFKRDSVEIYSELGGVASQSVVSPNIGAPSHDTIQVINGDVYFQSRKGWHAISNGVLVKKDKKPFHLGDGDIDNIFNDSGYVYEINKSNSNTFFSVYYSTLDQYITFIKEAGSSSCTKSYNYEFKIDGFRAYSYPLNIINAITAEDSNGEEIVLLATEGGFIMKHSISEGRNDTIANGTTQAIETFGSWYWVTGDDMDCTYNFSHYNMRALINSNNIQMNYLLDYLFSAPTVENFDFSGSETGFVLDVSKLDEGILSDGRTVTKYTGTINKTAQSLLINFYHKVASSNINLLEAQLDFSKNGK